MITLNFPARTKLKYYDFYVSSVKSSFEVAEHKIIIDNTLKFLAPAAFFIKINGKKAFVELSDFDDEYNWNYDKKTGIFYRLNTIYNPAELDMPIFKRTMRAGKEYAKNVFPLGPFYAQNNKDSKDLKTLLSIGNIYDPFNNDGIFHFNRIYAQNIFTRKKAFGLIDKTKLNPKAYFITDRTDQYDFWLRHRKCLSSLNISGASKYTQDTGPIEAMFLGVCPITNDFDLKLPYNKQIEKNVHYILVNDDYSNINECINFLYDNRKLCKEMGAEAYNLMMETSSPLKRSEWMAKVVEEYYV